jgi:hypothetical protein
MKVIHFLISHKSFDERIDSHFGGMFCDIFFNVTYIQWLFISYETYDEQINWLFGGVLYHIYYYYYY